MAAYKVECCGEVRVINVNTGNLSNDVDAALQSFRDLVSRTANATYHRIKDETVFVYSHDDTYTAKGVLQHSSRYLRTAGRDNVG